MGHLAYHKVLFKLSGEILKGENTPIDFNSVLRVGRVIQACHELGNGEVKIGIVVGGGNIWRGREDNSAMNPVTADHIGMTATLQNALALENGLTHLGVEARAMGAVKADELIEPYCYKRMRAHHENGKVVIFAGGTGNPFSTTDSAAALRAKEMDADVLVKFTTVDGVYDKDPRKHKDAKMFKELTFDEAIERRLRVMDPTAFTVCREHNIPIRVLNMEPLENIIEVVQSGTGQKGTLIHNPGRSRS